MEAVDGPADLLVNCTAVGMQASEIPGAICRSPPTVCADFGCVVDLVYRER